MLETALLLLLVSIAINIFDTGAMHMLPIAAAVCMAGHLLKSKA
mgnify:CR=1 FL=1|jgi:hypothetical protein